MGEPPPALPSNTAPGAPHTIGRALLRLRRARLAPIGGMAPVHWADCPLYGGLIVRIAKRQGIAVVLSLLMLLGAGCSSEGDSKEDAGATSPSAKPGVNDINPTDRAELADGGKLTWPIDTFPSNFNLHELDGALADGAAIMGALLPSMFN